MFVITKRDDRLLNSCIVEGFGGTGVDAAIVFSHREYADGYLRDACGPNSVVAEVAPVPFLQYALTLVAEGVDQFIINPKHKSGGKNAIEGYSVIELAALLDRAATTAIREISLAAEVPTAEITEKEFLYHCQNCGNIVQASERSEHTCCNEPMVLGATTNEKASSKL